MRKALSVVALLALVAGVANAGIYGAMSIVPVAPGATDAIDDGAKVAEGPTTVDIWGIFPNPADKFIGIKFSIHTTGDLTADVQMDAIQYLGVLPAWNPGSVFSAAVTPEAPGVVDLVAVTEQGAPNPAFAPLSPAGGMKLGTMAIDGTAGEVILDVQILTITGSQDDPMVTLGWDATPVAASAANAGQLADAPFVTVVPEPASLVLLALAGLVIRRR